MKRLETQFYSSFMSLLWFISIVIVVGILYWLKVYHQDVTEKHQPPNLCGVMTRNGNPCMSYKMKGYDRCFSHLKNKSKTPVLRFLPQKVECCICFIDKYPRAFRTFHCGHSFCKTCARKLHKCALCRADV